MEKQLLLDRELYAAGISEEAKESNIIFSKGKGIYVYDMDGKKYLDFSSGIFTNSLGHCYPALVKEQKKQLSKLGNIHDYPCEERVKLLNLLNSLTPSHINNFAFGSTGAEIIEMALRAIYTYYDDPNLQILTFKKGYHGKTGGIRYLMNWVYKGEECKQPIQVHFPTCNNCPFNKTKNNCNLECTQSIINVIKNNPNIKAFLFEPILGAGGIHIPPKEFWKIISKACKKYDVLMIDDEIFMAGGRIGEFLACNYFNIEPDIILMAKGLSSGYPFGVVAGRKEILSNKYFSNYGDVSSSYASHPAGITAALNTLQIIQKKNLIANVKKHESLIETECLNIKNNYSFISDVRFIGILYAIEFKEYNDIPNYRITNMFFKKCMSKGLKMSVGGNIVRISPPMIVKKRDIIKSFKIINNVLQEIEKGY